jgi:hypothetical protein
VTTDWVFVDCWIDGLMEGETEEPHFAGAIELVAAVAWS